MKTAQTKICLIIGDPVTHSLSPLMHNAAYEAIGMEEQFVYLAASVPATIMKSVIDAVRTLGIKGLTCTVPHKIAVIPFLDEIDHIAKKIGAVNSVVNTDGVLKGFNTDWMGAIIPLKKRIDLTKKKVLVIGAGGAARAVVFGLIKEKASVTITNRTGEKARQLAKEFGCKHRENVDTRFINSQDVIINTTSVGMHPHENESPLDTAGIHKGQILMDIVYAPYETKFIKQGKKKGATIIHGIEMLLFQGTAQFELYTGVKAPIEVMRKTLVTALHL
ncbi:MAG: shikimate dehydrogenase [bacterium]